MESSNNGSRRGSLVPTSSSLETHEPRSRSSSPSRELSAMSTPKQPAKFAQDYTRIHTLMQNKELFVSHLGGLEQSLSQGTRLKDALYQTEQRHGFAPQIHRTGNLDNQDQFMGALKQGVMFKDRGAAQDHGENAHRLQWHVVAKDMEANPKEYTATHAVQLYQHLATRYAENKPYKHNWKSLFDENDSTGDFRQPETLTSHLRTQTAMPHLQAASLQERTKRQALGSLGDFKKGPERDKYIENMRSVGLEKDPEKKFHSGGSYTPRVRTEGQQPKTAYHAFDPVKRVEREEKKDK